MFGKNKISVLIVAVFLASAFTLFGCATGAPSIDDMNDRSGSGANSSANATSADVASASSANSATSDDTDNIVGITLIIDASALSDTDVDISSLNKYQTPQTMQMLEGSSAYDALTFSGVEIGGDSSFVSSINGIGENLDGAGSGWMYEVNGDIPTSSAGQYFVEEGDEICWYYGSWN